MEELQQWPEEDLWSKLGEAVGRERIDILFELGSRASQRDDFATASTLWQEIEAAAQESGDVEIAAEAIRLQGGAAFFAGDYDAAVELYRRAAKGHEEAGRARDTAGALWCLADCYRALGDFESQLGAAREARTIAEFEAEHSMAGDACLLEARALYALNQDAEAVTACTAGRDHYRSAERPDKVAQIDDFAVTVHLYLGNLDEALELARGCLVLARTSSSEEDDPYARLRLAEVFQRRGDSDQALEHAGLAMTSYRARNDLIGAAWCEQLRAEALFDKGDSALSLEAFADARVLFDATGRDFDALRCETRYAIVQHYIGDYHQAARVNRRLVGAFSRLDDSEEVRWTIVRLLDNLNEDGLHAECLEAAEQYMDAWPDGSTAEDPTYREFLGLYALALEANDKADQATAIANHVIAHTPAREARIGTAYCYEVRGRSQLDSDEAAASQDFSHAIALHLARGRVDRARELSKYFLPTDGDGGARGGSGAQQAPVGGEAGHG